jgi:hypothetical protein
VGNSLAVLGWGRVAGRASWINTPRRSTERWWSSSFMSRSKAGDETNRALVAYVRNLSDEELADLLLSLDPKVYQELLERALGQQPSKPPPRVKP